MRTTPETELPAAGTEPARVTTGAIWAEGPVWWPRRRAVLFSDLPGVPSRDSTSSTSAR